MLRKVQPRGDRVVIRVEDPASMTKNGIIIPDSAKESQPAAGYITEVGPLVPEGDLKVGDLVLFSKYAGDDVEINGLPFKIMHEESVLGVLVDA